MHKIKITQGKRKKNFMNNFDLNNNEAQNAPIVPDKNVDDSSRSVSDSYTSFLNHGYAGIVAAAPYYSTIEANPNVGVQAIQGAWSSRFAPRVYQAGGYVKL